MKRCMELSPSCKQPAKRSAGKSRGKASAKQLLFGETSTEVSKSDQQEFVEKADPSSIVNNAEELSTPLRDSQHQDDHENNLGAIISGALNSYHIKGVNLTHKTTSCIDCFSAIVR